MASVLPFLYWHGSSIVKGKFSNGSQRHASPFMKNSFKIFALIAALGALAASAVANTVTFGANNSNYRTGNGGEFTLTPGVGDPDHLLNDYPVGPSGTNINGTSFETFCIQYGEHISLGATYFTGISDAAKGPTGTDYISVGTAWLYGQFAQGILGGYTYTPGAGRATSAGILQQAIWYLEDEITLTSTQVTNNIFLTGLHGALTHYGSKALAQVNSNGSQGVKVLNLATSSYNASHGIWDAQDQLIWPRVPHVPDQATTIALLGLGLLGLVSFRRKVSK